MGKTKVGSSWNRVGVNDYWERIMLNRLRKKISSAAKSNLSALAEDERAKKSLNVLQWIHLRFFRALIFTHHQNLEFPATKPFFHSLLRKFSG